MVTLTGRRRTRLRPIRADGYEKLLAVGAVVLLAAVATAVVRGRAQWAAVPVLVWVHLATVVVALALTPFNLLRRRGDRAHRVIGTIWVVAMLATAIVSLGLHGDGSRLSIIHILSVFTLVQVPIIWWSARHHDLTRHRSAVRGMVTGALLIAGFFTFPFNRMLGTWLFG